MFDGDRLAGQYGSRCRKAGFSANAEIWEVETMILLYLLLAVLAVISVLLLICLVRACIHKKSVPQTPLVRRENPDAMRIAGKLSKMVL